MKKIEGTGRLHVKKGDTVVILSGKDRGATGTVQTAFPSLGKVTVEGLNMVTRHQKPKRDSPFGQIQQGVVRKPAALWVAKVMLQCPHCHEGTRPRLNLQPDGRRARYCRKCGKSID